MAQVRILVVDDSLTMRAMLEEMFDADPAFRVVGLAANAADAEGAIARLAPDVVTLDIAMPGMNGLAFLTRLMKGDGLPVVMVSSRLHDDDDLVRRALALGAAGCFDKAGVIRDAGALRRLVRDAARGRKQKPPPLPEENGTAG